MRPRLSPHPEFRDRMAARLRKGAWPIALLSAAVQRAAPLLLVAVAMPLAPPALAVEEAAALEFFEREVRPRLVAHCHACHGPAIEEPQGGLRLTGREAILAGGESGPAAVAGEPDESLLIGVLEGFDGPDMPPEESLPEADREIFRRWVEMGLPWPEETPEAGPFDLPARVASHWAWQPVDVLAPPDVARHSTGTAADAVSGPIDAFVLDALAQRDLQPAAAADRRTLIRRLSFDLIGLPPTPEEIDRFVADERPDATRRLVDRLLADPQFGARWGRHWLDLTRYAETYGHEFDYAIPHAWRYRDWVVDALNRDLPYDRFAIEQLAGDLLEEPRRDPVEGTEASRIASGFWWLGEAVHAPVDVRGDQATRVDNQIEVAGKTFLGLTISCARCHDHKFDAISQADYFALAGMLHSTARSRGWVDPHGQTGAAMEAVVAAREELGAQFAQRWDGAATQPPPASFEDGDSPSAAEADAAADSSVLFDFTAGRPEGATHEGWAFAPATEAETHRGWVAHAPPTDDATAADDDTPLALGPAGWLDSRRGGSRAVGTWRSPPFEIRGPALAYRIAARGGQVRLVIDGYFMNDYHQLLFAGSRMEADTQGRWEWKIQAGDLHHYLGHTAHLEVTDPDDGWIALAEVRWLQSAQPPQEPAAPQGIAHAPQRSPRAPREEASADAAEALPDAQPSPLAESLQRFRRAAAAVPRPSEVLAAAAMTDRDVPLAIRGDPHTPGEPVPRGDLTALASVMRPDQLLSTSAAASGPPVENRLDLARRWAHPRNPLFPRVAANRLWHHLTGRGIVASCDNLGVLGAAPTHPELLDWISDDLVRGAWSQKRLIRRIATSATYARQTRPPEGAAQRDAAGHWLSAARLRRLEGEAIRDALLALSGRLDHRLGGPGVPVHLTPFMTGRGRPGESGPLDGEGRRSVYLEVRRNFLSPLLVAFDFPLPATSVGQRNRSNVPAQALTLLNDPLALESAARWARRIRESDASDAERIERMYVEAFAREPSDAERSAALAFLASAHRSPHAPREEAPPEEAPPEEAWIQLAHVLINSKEFIFLP